MQEKMLLYKRQKPIIGALVREKRASVVRKCGYLSIPEILVLTLDLFHFLAALVVVAV